MLINKKKIINDPVYGFISINSDIIFDIIQHPSFQRLRRIRQLGLTNMVYPGANHSRFQHALGTLFLMNSAISVIRSKGHKITEEEAEAVSIAILLHDIGHGPYSHALENIIVGDIPHEYLSLIIMEKLNEEFDGKISLAIKIFKDEYSKHFLHELVSSQLDMDRLDYLKRDSFFTGVSEGVIGSDRIIKMLNVKNDKLVIEEKGIYSIEKFLIARRLMYWQVYLHKTVISAEYLLNNIIKRARELKALDKDIFASPSFEYFLKQKISKQTLKDFSKETKEELLDNFSMIDDSDILCSIKVWEKYSEDHILKTLCSHFINRQLFKIEIQNTDFNKDYIKSIKDKVCKSLNLDKYQSDYFVIHGYTQNNVYSTDKDEDIIILSKKGNLTNINESSEIFGINSLSLTTKKYFLIYPKGEF